MGKENKVVAMVTTAAMTISVLSVLVGSGIGWGILQTRITALEARADTLKEDNYLCTTQKLSKEVYYKDQERLTSDMSEIKDDIKLILQFSRRTNQK